VLCLRNSTVVFGYAVMTAPALPVTKTQRVELVRMASSTTLPHRQVVQAKALLWAAQGVANQEIARRCEVDSDAVRRWRTRFEQKGVGGVGVIAKGRGRKPGLPEGTVAEIVRVTCHEAPDDTSTHWTTRLLAKRFGIGKDVIARVWADHNLKPWRVETFKVSTDPRFEDGVVDPRSTRGHLELPGTYMRRYEAPLRSRIDPEANCACREAR
jgi:transposase